MSVCELFAPANQALRCFLVAASDTPALSSAAAAASAPASRTKRSHQYSRPTAAPPAAPPAARPAPEVLARPTRLLQPLLLLLLPPPPPPLPPLALALPLARAEQTGLWAGQSAVWHALLQ